MSVDATPPARPANPTPHQMEVWLLGDRVEELEKKIADLKYEARQAREAKASTEAALEQRVVVTSKLIEDIQKRCDGIAKDRDGWRERAISAEQLHDAIARGAMERTLEDNARLRAELGKKDQELSGLEKDLLAASTKAAHNLDERNRAERKLEDFRHSVESTLAIMTRARDEAYRGRDEAVKLAEDAEHKRLEIARDLAVQLGALKLANAKIAEIEAAAKGKAVTPAPAGRKA
ncbi:MAG: hypothetical protein ACRD1X_12435 [Vicinamibacteria bacterium]